MKKSITVVLLIFMCLIFVSCGNASNNVARNADFVHQAYESIGGGWSVDKKYEAKLKGYGLDFGYLEDENWCSDGTLNWIIDEEFIKYYIDTYSAGEMLEVFEKFVDCPPSNSESNNQHIQSYTQYVEETAAIILSTMESKTFIIDTSVEPLKNEWYQREVKGKFNEGQDNHVVTKTANQYADLFYFDGYVVENIYGQEYREGKYGWYNGKFYDEPSKFVSMDYYSVYCYDSVDNKYYLVPGHDSLETIRNKTITIFSVEGTSTGRRMYSYGPKDLEYWSVDWLCFDRCVTDLDFHLSLWKRRSS